jgi:hypothetical protein
VSQPPQAWSGRSPASAKQVDDQLLGLLVVAEHLRSDALGAGEVFDYLGVVALSRVGERSLKVNLAAAADEAWSEVVGVDLVGDLHGAVGLVEAHRGSQRMGADVRRSEPGPRVVASTRRVHPPGWYIKNVVPFLQTFEALRVARPLA